MTELSKSLKQEALDALDSNVCACGATKKVGNAFCNDCYFALPSWMKRGLYKTVSEGFVDAWDEARDFLRYEVGRVK